MSDDKPRWGQIPASQPIGRTAASIGAALVMSVLFLSGCGSSQQDNAAAPVETVTVTAQPTNQPSSTQPTDQASSTPSDEPSEEAFKMPELVGMGLQDAQDKLQSLGSYLLDQQDATGLGRMQILDSNWKVCSQDPGPGAKVPLSAMVSLASVKLSESCP
jgi:hypothetical protein